MLLRTIIFPALALAALSGCDTPKGSTAGGVATERSGAVGGAIERIDTRASFITNQAKTLPMTPPKTVIIEQSALIHDDAEEARSMIAKLNTDIRLMAGSINNLENKVSTLEAEKAEYESAWIGPKTRRTVDRIIIGVIGFGILSVILGILSPAGIGRYLSALINTNIFAPFMLIRDGINAYRGWKTVTAKSPPAILPADAVVTP